MRLPNQEHLECLEGKESKDVPKPTPEESAGGLAYQRGNISGSDGAEQRGGNRW